VANKEEIIDTLMTLSMRRNDKITDEMGLVEYKSLQIFKNDDEFAA